MAPTRSRKSFWAKVRRAVCCCFSTHQDGIEIEVLPQSFQLEEDLRIDIKLPADASAKPLQLSPNPPSVLPGPVVDVAVLNVLPQSPPPVLPGPVVHVAGLNARLTVDGNAMPDWDHFQTTVHGRIITVRRLDSLDSLSPTQLSTTLPMHDEHVLKGVYVIDGLFDADDARALCTFPTTTPGWANEGVNRGNKGRLSRAQVTQLEKAKEIIRALVPVGYRPETPVFRFQGRGADPYNIHKDGPGKHDYNVYDIRVCLRVPLDQSTNVISLVRDDEKKQVERGAQPSYRLHLQPGQAYLFFGNFSLDRAQKSWQHWTESYVGMTYMLDFKS